MLDVTPALLAAAYETLRCTAPFDRWKLPHATKLRFGTFKTAKYWGDYEYEAPDRHVIRASETKHTRLETLFATMAHEMIHLKLELSGARRGNYDHGPEFRRLAGHVCRTHPMFDSATF